MTEFKKIEWLRKMNMIRIIFMKTITLISILISYQAIGSTKDSVSMELPDESIFYSEHIDEYGATVSILIRQMTEPNSYNEALFLIRVYVEEDFAEGRDVQLFKVLPMDSMISLQEWNTEAIQYFITESLDSLNIAEDGTDIQRFSGSVSLENDDIPENTVPQTELAINTEIYPHTATSLESKTDPYQPQQPLKLRPTSNSWLSRLTDPPPSHLNKLKAECDNGRIETCSTVGWLYEEKGELENAFKYYRKACQGGYEQGCQELETSKEEYPNLITQ